MTSPTPPIRHLSDLYDTTLSHPDMRVRDEARNTIARSLERLLHGHLRLPASVRSYRQDCLQELTLGLYQLFEKWHRDGRLNDIQSLSGFVRQYVRWHLPSILRRVAFHPSSPNCLTPPVYESELDETTDFRSWALERTPSGVYQNVHACGTETDDARLFHLDAQNFSQAEQRILEQLDTGETSRRRIELDLVETFGVSHRQARRIVQHLAERLGEL